MEEMKVYIANLGKYNEGELVGAWFDLPIDYEEVKEKIGLNNEYEEYALHDYELPFKVDEYTSIENLNRIYELIQELDGSPIIEELNDILLYWFSDIEELVEHKEDIICYSDCESMEDIAYRYVEEGLFGEVSDWLSMYINYSAIARDLEINGNFLVTNHGIFEYYN